MGYEIILKYHEKLESGYDKENEKTTKKRVGKAEDDVAPEKLAGVIMAQLARRDIWVVDVEVYEFAKRKVAFKETKGGLVIGNKKYNLDQCGQLGVEETPEAVHQEQPQSQQFHQHIPPKPQHEIASYKPSIHGGASPQGATNVADLQLLKKRPMRYEIFQPDPAFVDMTKARAMAFTVGDKYPIYAERAAGPNMMMGMLYTTIDNQGRKQMVGDKHFVPVSSLIGGDQFNERRDVELQYGDTGGFDMPMPNLR